MKSLRRSSLVFLPLAAAALAAACSGGSGAKPDAALDPNWCGRGQNPPGVTAPDGFCVKHFAQVTEARTLALAPNGDLFVGAPGMGTPGGASGGPSAII